MIPYDPRFELDLPQALFGEDGAAALRAADDMVFRLRTFSIRFAMFMGAALLSDDDGMHAAALDGMARSREGHGLAFDLICRGHSVRPAHPEAAATFETVRDNHPDEIRIATEYGRQTADILGRFRGDDPPDRAEFNRFLVFSYEAYAPAIMRIGLGVSAECARRRDVGDAGARGALERARAARLRIQSIARTVRLISINASVEAARAGDAGRSFAVIAREIGALSEQTAEVSIEMGHSMEEILAKARL